MRAALLAAALFAGVPALTAHAVCTPTSGNLRLLKPRLGDSGRAWALCIQYNLDVLSSSAALSGATTNFMDILYVGTIGGIPTSAGVNFSSNVVLADDVTLTLTGDAAHATFPSSVTVSAFFGQGLYITGAADAAIAPSLGIGVTNPSTKLQVDGTVTATLLAGPLTPAADGDVTVTGPTGYISGESSVTASAFYGQGLYITGADDAAIAPSLGIGVTNPSTKLQVDGTVTATLLAGPLTPAADGDVTVTGSAGYITSQASVTASAFYGQGLHITGADDADIAGSLGIGVTNPSTKLQVDGTVTATLFAGPLTPAADGDVTVTGPTGYISGESSVTASAFFGQALHMAGADDSAIAGSLGIGVTNPSTKLQVDGTVTATLLAGPLTVTGSAGYIIGASSLSVSGIFTHSLATVAGSSATILGALRVGDGVPTRPLVAENVYIEGAVEIKGGLLDTLGGTGMVPGAGLFIFDALLRMNSNKGINLGSNDQGQLIFVTTGDDHIKLFDTSTKLGLSIGDTGKIALGPVAPYMSSLFELYTSTLVMINDGGTGGYIGVNVADPDANLEIAKVVDDGTETIMFKVADSTFVVTSKGRVGVGLTNPSVGVIATSNNLEVAGDIGVADYIYHVGDTNTRVWWLADRMKFLAGGLWYMDAQEAGMNSHLWLGGDATPDLNYEVHVGTMALFSQTGNIGLGNAAVTHPFQLHTSTLVMINDGGTAGYIGINTAAPASELEIKATVTPTITLDENGNDAALIFANNAGLHLEGVGSRNVHIRTNSVERIRIENGGDVGIGIANPTTLLELKADGVLTLSGPAGYINTASSINASAFFGDGSGLTGLPGAAITISTVNAPGAMQIISASDWTTINRSSITITVTNSDDMVRLLWSCDWARDASGLDANARFLRGGDDYPNGAVCMPPVDCTSATGNIGARLCNTETYTRPTFVGSHIDVPGTGTFVYSLQAHINAGTLYVKLGTVCSWSAQILPQ